MAHAPVTTDRAAKKERIARAAVDWVYGQNCANALAELEDAVVDLIGVEIGDDHRHALKRIMGDDA